MRLRAQHLVLALISSVIAVRVPFTRHRRDPSSSPNPAWKQFSADPVQINLQSSRDLIYIAQITVAGQSYTVQLDTGSSDLWVQTSNGISGQSTGLTLNLTYGIGFAYGDIVTADVSLAGYDIPNQALLNAMDASNPVMSLGAVGVFGCGFTSLSNIDSKLNSTGKSTGRAFLWNAFAQDPTTANYITFLLSRSHDPDSPSGVFTISEYDSQYSGVGSQPQIPTFPENSPQRWTVLLDSFSTNGQRNSVGSGVPGAPGGKAVMLMDSGTTYTYAPTSVVNAIYQGLTGTFFDNSVGQWVVPCAQEIDFSIFIGGQEYDVHPLDMVIIDPNNAGRCIGTFIPLDLDIGSAQFDWLVGDSMLRSFYTVFNFGDPINHSQGVNPYVQLLGLMSAAAASADFHAVRGGATPATNGTINGTATITGSILPTTTAGGSTSSGGNGGTDGGGNGDSGEGSDTSGPDSIEFDAVFSAAIDKVVDYMPIMLGVLALNAGIMFVIIVFGLLSLCRRSGGKKGKKTRPNPTAYRPVRTTADALGAPVSPGVPSPTSPSFLVPPAPQYDSSTLPPRHPGPVPDNGAPQYNSMTM